MHWEICWGNRKKSAAEQKCANVLKDNTIPYHSTLSYDRSFTVVPFVLSFEENIKSEDRSYQNLTVLNVLSALKNMIFH